MLKTRQLACFVAVAETLNFRAAAERLCMTQPPLSRQIRRLEEMLGVQLLERDRQGVRLTEAGKRFLQDARALLADVDATLQKARAEAGASARTLTVGLTTVVDSAVFPDLTSLFKAEYPDIQLNVQSRISRQLVERLRRGDLDVALIGLPSSTGALKVERLFDDPLAVALPSGHPLARKRRLSLNDLRDETLFWFERGRNPAFHDHCQRLFAALSFSPRIVLEPEDHHVLLGRIAADGGIGLIARSLTAIRRGGVVYRPLSEGGAMAIGIGVAYRPDDESALVRAFVQSVRAYYARREA
ncbi:MAG: LysR family transcriptional regulator [Paludibacterium sp.]|uniref:LysR family transcriptional regulator n=1 Tax=Paludibacterium sp. TaxID=1917523 RepID=UPI0025E51610|nr:LysR family transcriptional regulator [Paludibacterium sp.]MBV8047094.1 LysR family transcriptional regulator [Paludibacterium sp.]MBV8648821.1 LysR family transcriptional regulator [Paludibacterium sp.]